MFMDTYFSSKSSRRKLESDTFLKIEKKNNLAINILSPLTKQNGEMEESGFHKITTESHNNLANKKTNLDKEETKNVEVDLDLSIDSKTRSPAQKL